MRAAATDLFLGAGAAIALASSIGILLMRDAYRKLHFVTPLSLVAAPAVGIAILIKSGWSNESAQAWLAIGFMMIASSRSSPCTGAGCRCSGADSSLAPAWLAPSGGCRAAW